MAITLDTLRKTVKKNKGKSLALAWLADMERASGDYEAALKIVDEALAASPSDVPAMLVRAKILAGQQDFAGSVSEYKKVLAKDPFCLSAHKRMGEAYEQLGKTTERNMCFRRVHDMDPLDSFWKEEYDVLPEELETNLAAPPMDDDSFTMDMESETGNTEEDNVFANLASSMPNSDEEDNASMDDLLKSLNSASDGIEEQGDNQDQSYGGSDVLSTSEVSSAITGILGGDDDLDSADVQAGEASANASPFSSSNALASDVAPKSDENLFSLDASSESESQPTNVDDAFSSIFGEDDAFEEKPAEASDSISDWSPSATPVADADESLETPKEEDKATNVDDAFSSIFGDDDLPEEKPAETSESLSDWSPSATPVAEAEESLETPKEEDKATNVDDAFSSIFGEDDVFEEKPAEETLSEKTDAPADLAADTNEAVAEAQSEPAEEDSFGGLFEKSADAEFSVGSSPEEKPSEDLNNVSSESSIPSAHMDFADDEVAADDAPKEEDKATNVDDAFSSIFGDDDLPEEKPADETLAEKTDAPENSATDTNEFVAETQNEPTEDDSFGGLFEKSADAEFTIEGNDAVFAENADVPAVEPSVSEKSEASEPEQVSASESITDSVDGAFDALFEDEADADAPVEESLAANTDSEEPQANLPAEDFSLNNDNLDLPSDTKQDDIADEMCGAFASMFGNEDDLSLPEGKPEEEPTEKKTAEAPLSQEATSAAVEEDAVKDVDESFDSLFGNDDELPEEKTEIAPAAVASVAAAAAVNVAQTENPAPAVEPEAEKSSEARAEAPSAELDSIDSEVSNAFKGLFDEDDTLAESDEPSNKGVDYLMSGDSDDEVAASLVNNADAPLSRGAADLDDSLNTRTLADIYMEQGVYNKALDIYADLVKKNPDDAEIKTRYDEIEKLCREKFGEA